MTYFSAFLAYFPLQQLTMKLSAAVNSSCGSSIFSVPAPFGAEIISIQAAQVNNVTKTISSYQNVNHPTISVSNLSFCNVTSVYTHPGYNDTVTVQTWLPLHKNWNGRFRAVGGAGWSAGGDSYAEMRMFAALAEGYATATTDSGLIGTQAEDPSSWALVSPGNVNLYLLQNLASRSLYDEAIISKAVIKNFYGREPQYSYWSGCSQGGRQGFMLAQRYPELYDGIVASAPAINWPQFFSTAIWPTLLMWWLKGNGQAVPRTCELDWLTKKGVEACDGNDGLVDGILSNPNACNFDPFQLVGAPFNCSIQLSPSTNATPVEMLLSHSAAFIANATWTGARSSTGEFLWYGLNIGADLTGNDVFSVGGGIARTTCTEINNGTSECEPSEFSPVTKWIQLFMEKDPSFNVSSMTRKDFDRMVKSAIQQYESIIGTNDPDLSQYKNRGGKILTFHGLLDQAIPNNGTERYYNAVSDAVTDIHSFFRYFEAPGVGHCVGGPGAQVTTIFDALRAWVENGTAPDTLPLAAFTDASGKKTIKTLYPYPQR